VENQTKISETGLGLLSNLTEHLPSERELGAEEQSEACHLFVDCLDWPGTKAMFLLFRVSFRTPVWGSYLLLLLLLLLLVVLFLALLSGFQMLGEGGRGIGTLLQRCSRSSTLAWMGYL
jgi:hypothetical protein